MRAIIISLLVENVCGKRYIHLNKFAQKAWFPACQIMKMQAHASGLGVGIVQSIQKKGGKKKGASDKDEVLKKKKSPANPNEMHKKMGAIMHLLLDKSRAVSV